jgi:hypothetical protein
MTISEVETFKNASFGQNAFFDRHQPVLHFGQILYVLVELVFEKKGIFWSTLYSSYQISKLSTSFTKEKKRGHI